MPSLDQLHAFVAAADEGSFSAAARKINKAQSAISTAIINLEIDVGIVLFDRAGRNPHLTAEGTALLKFARSVLHSRQEFLTHATSLSEGVETQLCIAVEQGLFVHSLGDIFYELAQQFPLVEFEVLEPGINDVPSLLREARVDIGVMMEQEEHPQGFHFRGVGYSRLIPVCGCTYSLAERSQVSHADLRHHRQLITRSRSLETAGHLRDQKSPLIWFSESPFIIMELLTLGLGWAVLPQSVVSEKLKNGELVQLHYDFQQTDILQGIDVVWTERRALGPAGQWLLDKLLALKPGFWSD